MTGVLAEEAPPGGPGPSPGRSWDEPAVLLALAAIVLAALWLGLALRPQAPGEGSPSAGFARDMATHHAQAVAMAETVRSRTTDAEVRALATDIALTQQSEIGQIQGWLAVWGLPLVGRDPAMTWMGHPTAGAMPGMATPAEIATLATEAPAEADIRFLRLMIPHHQAAILMAQAVLERTDRPEVTRLARGVVSAQRVEIAAMTEMLARRGSSPSGVTVTMGGGDAGHGSHGGNSLARAAGRAAGSLPLAGGIFAATWLGLDGARRHRGGTGPLHPAGRTRHWEWAAAGLVLAGLLHLGLTSDHFEESRAYGLFFFAATVAELGAAAALVAWPGPAARRTAVAVAGTLVLLYVLFRVVPPPGATDPEGFDGAGLLTQALQLGALGALVGLTRETCCE